MMNGNEARASSVRRKLSFVGRNRSSLRRSGSIVQERPWYPKVEVMIRLSCCRCRCRCRCRPRRRLPSNRQTGQAPPRFFVFRLWALVLALASALHAVLVPYSRLAYTVYCTVFRSDTTFVECSTRTEQCSSALLHIAARRVTTVPSLFIASLLP